MLRFFRMMCSGVCKSLLQIIAISTLSTALHSVAVSSEPVSQKNKPFIAEDVLSNLTVIRDERRKAGVSQDYVFPIFYPNVELSWDKGIVLAPDTAERLDTNKPKLTGNHPALIYLHGCLGLVDHDVQWGREVARQGFFVVMPNSFSRPNRQRNCNPNTKTGGHWPQSWRYRQEEIAYALAKLRTLPWIDKEKIFLMGHSEGGIAIATGVFPSFRGLIISGWTCTHKNFFELDGIAAPPDIPTLVLYWDRDPWYFGTPMEGTCLQHSEGRKDFQQILLRGSAHDTQQSKEFRDAVREFLKKYK